ncbi:MAG: beta-glycosidase [Prevotella sp.]|nr:beta-glycosidase [Prevotella sp.]
MKKACLMMLALICLTASSQGNYREYLPLNGTWRLQLDPNATVKPNDVFDDQLILPGTTDTNQKGYPLTKKDETTHLSRLFSYVGRAWYKKTVEIPMTWKKKRIFMHLERTKPTTVYVDGNLVGSSQNISTPQTYDLTTFMKPGKHIIAIMVDNSENAMPKQIISNSHACTEDTQTNWNGILGNMTLEAANDLMIDNIQVKTSAEKREIETTIAIKGDMSKGTTLQLMLIPWGNDYGYVIATHEIAKSKETESTLRFAFQVDSINLWSEFHPTFYRIRAELLKKDQMETTFGLRDFTTRGTQFFVNGNLTFLRGKHDACVFPNTAHVPTNIQEWRRYFQICKGYGINHVRFHSWCPPEACFLAADIEGIYLQPELPFWGDFNKNDSKLMEFLLKEGINIMRTYGHHPSFVMMALGNELWGDIPTMKLFTEAFRKIDNTKLYTFGSNYYLGYQGWKEGMDYFTTCRNGGEAWGEHNTHTRGSFSFADAADGGMINSLYPNTMMNFEEGIKGCPVPVISHETAQFQTYPDFNEIRKYHGVLYPYNMEVFRSRLEKAGMLDQAADFHKASGLWSVQLYKQDIEMGLRTPGFGGFQLLDLQDYPGQGSAYVGILDAFMESKGITTPQEFSQWCSPIVPLFLMEKYCWTADETLEGKVKLANYSEPTGLTKWLDGTLKWELQAEDGTVMNTGELPIPEQSIGLTDIGNIRVNLSHITKAQRLNLILHTYYSKLSSIRYTNSYPIWVYPARNTAGISAGKVIVSGEISDEMGKKLQEGASVLLIPCKGLHSLEANKNETEQTQNHAELSKIPALDSLEIAHFIEGMNPELTVGGLFQTDYWNYRMFKTISENNKKPVSPGTLGILTNPKHPIFRDFPTDMHTNWQWFPVVKTSRPFILDNTAAAYRPIVQVIDNIERNHKLGLIFEFQVGKGKLLVCMSPLLQLQQYPEARQLYSSIMQYMQSADFNPDTQITFDDLKKLFSTPVKEGAIGELNNISPYK